MFQKLENIYLEILRSVVILASGILLLAAILSGLAALNGLDDGPDLEESPPEVKTDALKSQVVQALEDKKKKDESANQADRKAYSADLSDLEEVDPNQAYYDRSFTAMAEFVKKTDRDGMELIKERVDKWLKDMASKYENEKYKEAFVKGLAEQLEAVLQDEAIIQEAKASTPGDVIDVFLQNYIKSFHDDIAAIDIRNAKAEADYEQEQKDADQALYYAGGSFVAFLLIVFLSIFIKIERNLRHLEKMAAKA